MSQQWLHDLATIHLRTFSEVSRSFETKSLLPSLHDSTFQNQTLKNPQVGHWNLLLPTLHMVFRKALEYLLSMLRTCLGLLQKMPLFPSMDYKQKAGSH